MLGNGSLSHGLENSATEQFVVRCPTLIVCEGNADKQFLEKLIKDRHLHGFQVEIAKSDRNDPNSGNSKFRSFLLGLEIPLSRTEMLKNIILFSDNDEKPAKSFNN